MAAPMSTMPKIALRGSQGIWMTNGPPDFSFEQSFPSSSSKACRCMCYSKDGSLLGYCDGRSVVVVALDSMRILCEISRPKTSKMEFSSRGSLLALYEPFTGLYKTADENPALYMFKGCVDKQKQAQHNVTIWDAKTGSEVKSFISKRMAGWSPQWTADEKVCARSTNNEIHFYEDNNFATTKNKLQVQKVADFSLATEGSVPYHVAAYVPGSKGQPSYVRIFAYPNFGGPTCALANKSFYNADRVEMLWNKKGNSMVLLTASETSADSYYGDQGLHFMDISGQSCQVPRAKNGPVYCVQWNPKSTEFCVVYGSMPAKATLYNLKCEPVFDFGTGPRNLAFFNPFGTILTLAGFGNLRGNIEYWDLNLKKMISNPQAPDTTFYEWCPDGIHVLTGTTAPRLRVGNGYKVWDYLGNMLHDASVPAEQELWEIGWQKSLFGKLPQPKLTYNAQQIAAMEQAATPKKYVPPALRNLVGVIDQRTKPKYRDEYEAASDPNKKEPENLSKQALKNKKKRDARKAKQAADAPPPSAPSGGATQMQPSGGAANVSADFDPETAKKARNLKKKLQAIEKLKEKQAAGEKLEINQLEKLKTEQDLLKELDALHL